MVQCPMDFQTIKTKLKEQRYVWKGERAGGMWVGGCGQWHVGEWWVGPVVHGLIAGCHCCDCCVRHTQVYK